MSISLRIDFGPDSRLGPGKVQLLEAVERLGSISAAARCIGMSYKRAWDLIEEMNHIFRNPVVVSKSGGRKGGGASLTESGSKVIAIYRAMERKSEISAKAELVALRKMTAA